MFCYQCEQAKEGKGCTEIGVCGKEDTTAKLQDLLVYATKGIAMYAHRAAELGVHDRAVDVGVAESLFATVTNVDFDDDRLASHLRTAATLRDRARAMYEDACRQAGQTPEQLSGPAAWQPADDLAGLIAQGEEVGIAGRQLNLGEDVAGLQELILYGLKGAASYVDHAQILGQEASGVYATFHQVLDFLTQENPTTDDLVGWALKTGELNLQAMQLLDTAHTGTYGHPEPTEVRITPVAGKAILISGHDLKDLEELLKQTEGSGVNIYTHGEMLPAHGYPGLKKYKHLVGNYGGAWQDQKKEFDAFPGSILMTTNCIQKPRETYKARIFTTGLVAWPGVQHIGPDHDFSPVIEAAQAADGFAADEPEEKILVGFAHNAVLNVADKVIEAVKAGAIRHFFLVGGCDGAKPGRNYYTDFAQQVPDESGSGEHRPGCDLPDSHGVDQLLVGEPGQLFNQV